MDPVKAFVCLLMALFLFMACLMYIAISTLSDTKARTKSTGDYYAYASTG